MTSFDETAVAFERHRTVPDSAAEQIGRALRSMLGPAPPTLLDLGAGTGRLGRALIPVFDRYIALDRSSGMLEEFRAAMRHVPESEPRLVRADGCSLPFRSRWFGAVLVAHVLSVAPSWTILLTEARRVLAVSGVLLLAQRKGPVDGLDARLREQLRTILVGMQVEMPEGGKVRRDARAWLAKEAVSHQHSVAARFTVASSPSAFLERHSTGARFAALAPAVQRESLRQLSTWATATMGALDASFPEEYTFDVDAFRFDV